MNKKEIWRWWNPAPLTKEHEVGDFCYKGANGLFATFYDGKDEPITFLFKGRIEAFRFTDEGSILSVFKNVEFKKGETFNFCATGNFIIENSKLKQEIIMREGGVAWESEEVIHFLFSTQDGVFEVLTDSEPVLVKEEKL
ncbi:hypothetical protein KAT08_02355 [Candidatus Babeliales bacterium]|nr:hypothetical protein [Candidatus Babeliales bacterium]